MEEYSGGTVFAIFADRLDCLVSTGNFYEPAVAHVSKEDEEAFLSLLGEAGLVLGDHFHYRGRVR